ncbi:MAG: hypothetical protein KIT58_12090 [Planctomycetota bacterium]|nr:hypothetical protein [Planctomycetota bacterium]
MSPRLALAALVLLSACATSEEQAPAPAQDEASRGQVEAVDGSGPAQPVRRRADHVLIDVTKADLATQVLPLFEEQVGLTIVWRGDPRQLTLRLMQPVPWEEALSLVCQFTRTHPTRDYQDRIVLKDGWGGDLGDGDIQALKARGQARGGSQGGRQGGGQAAQPGWNDGRQTPPPTGGGIPQPTGAYSGGDEATRLLQGTNSRTSPPR